MTIVYQYPQDMPVLDLYSTILFFIVATMIILAMSSIKWWVKAIWLGYCGFSIFGFEDDAREIEIETRYSEVVTTLRGKLTLLDEVGRGVGYIYQIGDTVFHQSPKGSGFHRHCYRTANYKRYLGKEIELDYHYKVERYGDDETDPIFIKTHTGHCVTRFVVHD
ncbi:hypothetical protein [Pseudoalteromonas sp. T1lg23B]|uniref:hypothetical protein n=1 Tax=Pseudoalteromonas sp. T1lg23B TaxID=2077097 RepID=UPI000CF6F1E0|nr:hypothetical protein [Pseudoalteromonas sp. T1lg23B]